MVAETQRVRVRLLWDDQKMRQSMAAAHGLDKVGKTMAAAHRERMRPLFNTPKFVGPMCGGELQRAAQAMADAYRASMRPALDASRAIRFALGGEKLQQMMAAAAGLDKIAKIVADSNRVRMPPLFDTQKLVGPMFGGEFQRIAQGMADAYQVPVRPRFDVQDVFDVAQGIVDATIVVPSNASIGSLTVVDGSVPAEGPLFPGLMNPWQQVRCWDLQDWIAFLTFVVTVAGLVVAMGQPRPQVGLSPEDLEKVIRTIQESDRPNTSKLVPNSTNTPTRATSTRSPDGEKGPAPTARPSPTSG